MKLVQIIVNLVLYGYLLWSLYNSTIVEWDPWDAFVVRLCPVRGRGHHFDAQPSCPENFSGDLSL